MLVIAHRGANSEAPENTLIAFSKAVEIGADFIEFDIRLTKDNEIIIMHDENTKRTTGYDGLIKNMTLSELKKLNCGDETVEAEIPTLEETINLKRGNTKLQIEMCSLGLIEPLYYLLKKYDLMDLVFVSSFKLEELIKLQRLNPDIKLASLHSPQPGIFEQLNLELKSESLETTKPGWVIDSRLRKKMVDFAIRHKFYAIHPHTNFVDEEMISYAHENKILFNVWTVNRKRLLNKYIKMGVDGIITDDPRLLKKLLIEVQNNK